jgi:hypothetical protein
MLLFFKLRIQAMLMSGLFMALAGCAAAPVKKHCKPKKRLQPQGSNSKWRTHRLSSIASNACLRRRLYGQWSRTIIGNAITLLKAKLQKI